MLFISQNPLKLAQNQELNKSKYSCPANNRTNTNAMLSSNFSFNSQNISLLQKNINPLLVGSQQKIDASLNKFDRFKMNHSSIKPLSSTNNALTLKMQAQTKSENGSSFFPNGYNYKQNIRISQRTAQSFNTPFQRYSQHAYLQKTQLQSNRASEVNETQALEDEKFSIEYIQKKNEEKSSEIIQKIEKIFDEQVQELLNSKYLISPENLWFLVSNQVDSLLREPKYQHIKIEWHQDIQKMAKQSCHQQIEQLNIQMEQKMKEEEYLNEVHKIVKQTKEDIRQNHLNYMQQNQYAYVDHLFQNDVVNEVMDEVQFQASEIIINCIYSKLYSKQTFINLANDFFQNQIDKNKLYTEGATQMNATMEQEKNEIILSNESKTQDESVQETNKSLKNQINQMLKQTPEIQGKTLEIWQKLGPMSVDYIGNYQKNQKLCLYIIDDGDDYYGKKITENKKIYGQINKRTNQFNGVVRIINTEKNSIYEGWYQNRKAQGQGRLIQADGKFYIGKFQSNKPVNISSL